MAVIRRFLFQLRPAHFHLVTAFCGGKKQKQKQMENRMLQFAAIKQGCETFEFLIFTVQFLAQVISNAVL